jgi:hypothetical protein
MKLLTRSLLVGVLCTAAFMFLPPARQRAQAGAPLIPQHLLKLDGLLRSDVANQQNGTRRVLVRTKSSDRSALKQQLESQGYKVIGDTGDALTAIVPTTGLETLAKSTTVLGISADAIVRPHADLLGGLLDGVTGVLEPVVGTVTGTVEPTLGSLLGIVGFVLDPSLDEGGQPVPPAILRSTLGLQDSSSGKARESSSQ